MEQQPAVSFLQAGHSVFFGMLRGGHVSGVRCLRICLGDCMTVVRDFRCQAAGFSSVWTGFRRHGVKCVCCLVQLVELDVLLLFVDWSNMEMKPF